MAQNQSSKTPRNDTQADPTLRERAIDAYDSARSSAKDAGKRVGEGIDAAPLAVLAGGLAVGALAGALMRRTAVEDRVLGPVGEKIAGTARNAVAAAKQAGQDKLAELDLTRDAGTRLVQSVLDGVGSAAKASGTAALGTVRGTGADE